MKLIRQQRRSCFIAEVVGLEERRSQCSVGTLGGTHTSQLWFSLGYYSLASSW